MPALDGTANLADHFGRSELVKIGALSMNSKTVEFSPQNKLLQIGTRLLKNHACGSKLLQFEGFHG